MVGGVDGVLRTVAVRHFGPSTAAAGVLEGRGYGGRGRRARGRRRVLILGEVLGYDVLHDRKRERD